MGKLQTGVRPAILDGATPRTPIRLRTSADRRRTTIQVPQEVLIALRREVARSGKNLSWVIEDILTGLDLPVPPQPDSTRPTQRNKTPLGSLGGATIMVSSALLVRLARAAGQRSLSWLVSDLLTAYFRDRNAAIGRLASEKGPPMRE